MSACGSTEIPRAEAVIDRTATMNKRATSLLAKRTHARVKQPNLSGQLSATPGASQCPILADCRTPTAESSVAPNEPILSLKPLREDALCRPTYPGRFVIRTSPFVFRLATVRRPAADSQQCRTSTSPCLAERRPPIADRSFAPNEPILSRYPLLENTLCRPVPLGHSSFGLLVSFVIPISTFVISRVSASPRLRVSPSEFTRRGGRPLLPQPPRSHLSASPSLRVFFSPGAYPLCYLPIR